MLDLASVNWTNILEEGLGATTARMSDGGTMACFKAGPFRIAYPDFVVGRTDCNAGLEEITHVAKGLRADMIRIQAPQTCADPRTQKIHELGTIAIGDLQNWNERQREKSRRAANRETRSELNIRKGTRGDGRQLHALYRHTVQRHGGSVRYSERYFELLAPHAALIAEFDGKVCGFVCAGYHGSRGLYLHGAHAQEARGQYPSDQLFLTMLREARDAGLGSFDFLATPSNQQSLGAYKRAWGGMDESLVVSDLALNPWRARGIAVAMRLDRALHQLISD